jgi:hypothetical protein
MSRAHRREYEMAQSGIPIASINDGDPKKHKRKLSFPFSLRKLAKKVHESPHPPITPEQPSSSISPRIRKALSLPTENLNDTSFVHSRSSPKAPTRRRHYHSHSRTQSKHSISPNLFLQKNVQFTFGTSMQQKMQPILPVLEAVDSELQAPRPPLMSRVSSKRKREDEGDAGRPVSRVRVEL